MKVSRKSLLKATGSNKPIDGAGLKGHSGRPRLRPNNNSKTMAVPGPSKSAQPLQGNQGPKRT